LTPAAEEIGGTVAWVRTDVTNSDNLDRLVHHIRTEKVKLDIVFANAGTVKYAPLGQISEAF
jgi:NADP-dependent 3-hydroxy acid dehydrogenase YdfG